MSITLALLIITGLVSYQALQDVSMRQKLMHHPYTEHRHKEYYRLLSSGFVHGSMNHLLINCFVLYMFGSQVENFVFKKYFGDIFGMIMYLTMYLTAIIAGDIYTHFKYKNDPAYAAVGASGATSAIVIIYCLVAPWNWFLYPPVPAIVFAIGYLGYSHWAQTNKRDNIGHSAHLYGGLYGLLFMAVTQPKLLGVFVSNLMEGPIWPPPFF